MSAETPDQVTIFAALGAPEPVPAVVRAPRKPAALRWAPCHNKTGACTDCFRDQHQAARHGRPVAHRHRVAWSYGPDLYCTPHAAERGCDRAGATQQNTNAPGHSGRR